MNITEAINHLLANHEFFSELHPSVINNGNCDEFAWEVEKLVDEAEAVWTEMWIECIPPDCSEIFKGLSLAHCFVEHGGKYYDAECPNGVNHPIQLPFFEQQMS